MQAAAVSVVVVSHGRPKSLMWCLSALAGLRHEPFEIVVVADLAAVAYVSESRFAGKVKLIPFETPNIAAARNRGIEAAAGEIIAFIDDDAAAEPMWLHHLTMPFDDESIAASGGYVRGRNGISYQWTAREVDRAGRARPLDHDGDGSFKAVPSAGFAVKTEGTNMALRRDVLCQMGGFDEAYHFFLDETDLNLRLADEGHGTALVPLAEVHHAYSASHRRGEDRTVRDLFDVGASSAVMLRKFGQDVGPRLEEIRAEQRDRLTDQRARGLLSGAQNRKVQDSLEVGFEAGLERRFGQYADLGAPKEDFLAFSPERSGSLVIEGWRWSSGALREQAKDAAARGVNVSLFIFGLNARYHRVRYDAAGYWEQSGGLFGKSERHQPLFRLRRFKDRLFEEEQRVAAARGLPG
ncbi:glycosyltransferase [Rhodobacteraceae bacterium 63075]|nr:glycosyltransferase [Rhodobacteraceae bacterium 63075]